MLSHGSFRDRSLFIEGLVLKRNGLSERRFLIEKGWINLLPCNGKVG